MLKRLHPAKTSPQSPLAAFSVLLIGQGFASQRDFEGLVKQEFWPRLVGTPPFEKIEHPFLLSRLFIFYDPCQELVLNVVQNGSTLSLSAADATRIGTFLDTHTVQDDKTQKIFGSAVWPRALRTGRNGSLVALIVKNATIGELWGLDSAAYPTPIVGVNTAGQNWMMPIIRTIGALYAGLVDEYSLPDVQPGDHDKFPLTYFAPLPNLVPFNDEQRARLIEGAETPRDILGCLPPAFKVNANTPLRFFTYEDNVLGPSTVGTGVNLFEGGAGFRHNVARGFKDCLMRRQPLASANSETIQAAVGFCGVCRNAIEGAIRGDPDFDFIKARRTTIDKQQTMYDLVNWGDSVRKSNGALPLMPVAATVVKPRWSLSVQANGSIGFRVTQLKLFDRDGDPFKDTKDVLQEIDYGDLSVTWDGDPGPTPLPFADAFANAAHPPQIEIAGPDPGGIFQIGIKVVLTWEPANKRPVEAALTFVARGARNDFDPGGAALACKFYPQIAMRVLEPYKREGKKRPKATALRGSIVCVCNNIIPTSIQAEGLTEFSTGIVQGSFFTDSNTTDYDGTYVLSLTKVAVGGAMALGAQYPYWGLYDAKWQGGRLLAAVGSSNDPRIEPDLVGGSTALYAYRILSGPLLPHWSWLFDYAAPALTARKEVAAATYVAGDKTRDGAHAGDRDRLKKFAWPAGSKYEMRVFKMGRQGQYDNIHIHAAMPRMGMMKDVVPAPFCADMCLHLHWRWGTDSVSSIAAPYAFLGWGDSGRGARGAHTSLGSPLIPPNQRLRVVGDPAANNTLFRLTYDVTAVDPGIGEWQVFLEQGMGIAFRYAIGGLTELCSPLNAETFPALLGALGVLGFIGDTVGDEKKRLNDLHAASKTNPAKAVELDAEIRKRFHDIYARIRYYDLARDGFDVQQVPDSEPALEDC